MTNTKKVQARDRKPGMIPPCLDCEWEVIRDMGGAAVRLRLIEPCGKHYRPRARYLP